MPGGPTIRMPFGIRPPIFVNFFGSRRNSTTSETSSFASSHPATSAKVSRSRSRVSNLARLLPKLSAPRPACRNCRTKRKYSRPIMMMKGMTCAAIDVSKVCVGCSANTLLLLSRSWVVSVTRPAARKSRHGALASLRLCPTMTIQSRPPLGSERITAALPASRLIKLFSARSTTS